MSVLNALIIDWGTDRKKDRGKTSSFAYCRFTRIGGLWFSWGSHQELGEDFSRLRRFQ